MSSESELFRLAAAVRAVESFLADLPKPRFVDLNTGIRARYFEWGAANQDGTVLLLHDLAHTASAFDALATALAREGFRVLAPDARGHGGTQQVSSYSPDDFGRDIEAFIVELDLYKRPLAVVAAGMSALPAALVAVRKPALVGALALVDPFPGSRPQGMGRRHPVQDLGRGSPWLAVHRRGSRHLDAVAIAAVLGGADGGRDATGAALQAVSLISSARPRACAAIDGSLELDDSDARMRDLLLAPTALRCPVMMATGGADASVQSLRSAFQAWGGRAICTLDGPGLFSMSDRVPALVTHVVNFVEAALVAGHLACSKPEERTPERLMLRELPDYGNLEAAAKALGPRKLPTAEAIERALEEAGGDASNDDQSAPSRYRTALAINPPDYFGMVG